MKPIFLLLLSVLFFGTTTLMAQDVIVRKDGTTIIAKVKKVGETTVEYNKWDNIDGPTYTLSTANILSINYANGSRDSFETKAKNNVPITAQGGISASNGTSTKVSNPTKTNTQNSKRRVNFGSSYSMQIGGNGIGSIFWAGLNIVDILELGWGFDNFNVYNYDDNLWNLFTKFSVLPLGKKKVSPYVECAIGPCLYDGELYAQVGAGIRLGGSKSWRWNIGFTLCSYGYAIEEEFAFKFGYTYYIQ